MKRSPIAFFPLCRAFLAVAFLAMTLSGCATFLVAIGLPIMAASEAIGDIGDAIEQGKSSAKYEKERAEREATGRIWDAAKQVREPLVEKARDYLQTACLKDERLFIKPGITLNDGVLLLYDNRGNAPLPLLATAPRELTPDAILQYRAYHYKENPERSDTFREMQYGYAIPWDIDDTTLEKKWWGKLALGAAEGQEFSYERMMDAKGTTLRLASKAHWEQMGLRERVLRDSPQMKELRDNKWDEKSVLWAYGKNPMWESFTLPVDTPRARYALAIEDISTLEDRAHWVARGRLRLIERATGETVAEYVGFMANLRPGTQEKSPSRQWSYDKDEIQTCPNTETLFHIDRWSQTPTYGFLHAIKKTRGKAVPNVAAFIPATKEEETPFLSRFTQKDGSIRVENTAFGDAIKFKMPSDKPLPSMVWRNVLLANDVTMLGNATVAGNVLFEGIQGLNFDLQNTSITGDLTIRDSQFVKDSGFMATIDATPHVLFERVYSHNHIILTSAKGKGGKRNQSVTCNFCSAGLEAPNLNAEHVRVENSAGHFSFENSRIGKLEIVKSLLGTKNEYTLDLSGSVIDELEITDSNIGAFAFTMKGARIARMKISGSNIARIFLTNARIGALEIVDSQIEQVDDPQLATIGSMQGGDEALRQKIMVAKPALSPRELLIQQALDYLQAACEKDERISIKAGITLNDGVLLPRDTTLSKPLPLLNDTPTLSVPPEIVASFGSDMQKSARIIREIQYGHAIPWNFGYPPYRPKKEVGYYLEQVWDAFASTAPGEQKFFVESEERSLRRASKAYWERAGLRKRVLKDSPQIAALRGEKFSFAAELLKDYEARPFWTPYDLRVDTFNAKYVLVAEDISTLEDRAHWVARGQLRLIERKTGAVVAEYIGFAATTNPTLKDSDRPYWNWAYNRFKDSWEPPIKMCPNTKRMFRLGGHDDQVRSDEDFLQLIRKARGKAVSSFDAPAPADADELSLSRFVRKDGSIQVENVRLDDFLSRKARQSKPDYQPLALKIPVDRMPSMTLRGVYLDRQVILYSAEDTRNSWRSQGGDQANATIAGNMLIEDVHGQSFYLSDLAITGNLTVRNSEFSDFSVSAHASSNMLFERLRSKNEITLRADEAVNAPSSRNLRVICRFCTGKISAQDMNAKHFRIEHSDNYGVYLYRSRIDALEVVESENSYWLYLDDAEIDRLEIKDSKILWLFLSGARIAQLKISNSKIKTVNLNNARIEALEITGSHIEEVENPRQATIGSIKTCGDAALLQKFQGEKAP